MEDKEEHAESTRGAGECLISLLDGVLLQAGNDALVREPMPSERTTLMLLDAVCLGPSAAARLHNVSVAYMSTLTHRYRQTTQALLKHRQAITAALMSSAVSRGASILWQTIGTIRPPVVTPGMGVKEQHEIVRLASALSHLLVEAASVQASVAAQIPQVGRIHPPREMKQLDSAIKQAQAQFAASKALPILPETSTEPAESSTIPPNPPDL